MPCSTYTFQGWVLVPEGAAGLRPASTRSMVSRGTGLSRRNARQKTAFDRAVHAGGIGDHGAGWGVHRRASSTGLKSRGQRAVGRRSPVDVDVDEMALGRRERLALREQAHLVAHAGLAERRHPDARLDRLGERQRGEIVALGLYHQADWSSTVSSRRSKSIFGVSAAAAGDGDGGGRRWRSGSGPGRRADRVRCHPDSGRPEQDPGDQGRARADQPGPEGGQGSGRGRAQAGQGSVSKEEADAAKAKLVEAGATADIK